MVFYSIEFVQFFVLFFFLYWLVFKNDIKWQNLLILAGSYAFYALWDWRFLFLLVASSCITYFLGLYISKTENEKRQNILLFVGLVQGLGVLLFFKYYNFFIHSFVKVFSIFNVSLDIHSLNLILPLGISFYTFRSISYLLDISSERIKPTSNWVVFFTYISFFPCLLAGPIDKARDFIPQLEKKRVFNYNLAVDGLRQILWGLFKKIVIADNCTVLTNYTFDNYQILPASSLLIGSFFYSIQVYADFSGYSDMAIGFSKLIGFNVTQNFNFPFFSKNIAEFWQNWHMSLTTWMSEYVFTPLSFVFRKYKKWGLVMAIIINFILIGIWHGDNLTFIVFGFLHGCYFIPLILNGTLNNSKKVTSYNLIPKLSDAIKMAGVFILIMLTTVIFRANTVKQAYHYYAGLISSSLLNKPYFKAGELRTGMIITLIFIVFMFVIEWLGRDQTYGIANFGFKFPKPFRWLFYSMLIFLIGMFMSTNETPFLYFKF